MTQGPEPEMPVRPSWRESAVEFVSTRVELFSLEAKEAGKSITLKNYIRFQFGEGIEKETSDFAAEVAAAAGV